MLLTIWTIDSAYTFIYKIPGEMGETIYPSLSSLLSTCKFLSFEGRLPQKVELLDQFLDKNVAVLMEAFPDTSNEDILKALKLNKGDVNAALDYLLTTGSPSPKPTPKNQHVATKEKEAPVSQDAPVHQAVSVLSTFSKVSSGKVAVTKDMNITWQNVRPGLRVTFDALEGNLAKILQTPTHALAKKLNTFAATFNQKYSGELNVQEKYGHAVSDVVIFLHSMQQTIRSKVPDFTQIGSGLWKVLEMNLFPQIYPVLWQLFAAQHVAKNTSKLSIVQKMANISTTETEIPLRFQLVNDVEPYASAINLLRGIPSYRCIHQKVHALIQACHAIQAATGDYYTKNPRIGAVNVTADDLGLIFTYALIKSQIPCLYSELALIGNFLPETLIISGEGFALAVFEASITNIDTFKVTAPPRLLSKPNTTAQQPQLQPPIYGQPYIQPQPQVYAPQQPMMGFQDPYTLPPAYPTHAPQTTPQYNGYFPVDQPNFTMAPSYPAYPMPNPTFPLTPSLLDDSTHVSTTLQQPLNPFTPSDDDVAPPYPGTTTTATTTVTKPTNPDELPNGLKYPEDDGNKFATLAKVEKSYVEALKSNASTAEDHTYLAAYYEGKGKPIKAIEHCKLALAIEPDNEIAQNKLTALSRKLGMYGGQPTMKP